jgi:hypothetical protein
MRCCVDLESNVRIHQGRAQALSQGAPVLTAMQVAIRDRIATAARSAGSARVVHCSEWLGYLPFGAYHWVECEGASISGDFPADWSSADLAALERHGFLKLISAWTDPDDEFHSKTTYEVYVPVGRGAQG